MTKNDIILQQLKEAQLRILEDFITVCEKLNLKYYLAYGTLLGAIRHKGFIPWDDDIDLFMTRKDFEKFKKEAPTLLPKHLFIQTRETDPEFIYSYMKIRNSNTTFIETTSSSRNINHGIFIDIFPLDYYPNKKSKAKLFAFLCCTIRRRINLKIWKWHNSNLNFFKKLFILIQKIVFSILLPSTNFVLFLQKKICQSEKKGNKYVPYHEFRFNEKDVFDIDWFNDGTKVKFEHLTVTAPADYHNVLTKLFGDYMKLPPKEQQIPHHFSNVIDFNKSYKEYMKNNSTRGQL